jgi:hypothetical protein
MLKYILKKKKYSPEEIEEYYNSSKFFKPRYFPIRKKLTRREKLERIRQSAHKTYLKHKEKHIKWQRAWELRNPEKVKEYAKKTFSKWWKKKKSKEWMRKWMKEYYYKHHEKFLSGSATYKLKEYIINKSCKLCKANQDLQIHHEIYPIKKDEIIKAIEEGKIYYLCKKCHREIHKIFNSKETTTFSKDL